MAIANAIAADREEFAREEEERQQRYMRVLRAGLPIEMAAPAPAATSTEERTLFTEEQVNQRLAAALRQQKIHFENQLLELVAKNNALESRIQQLMQRPVAAPPIRRLSVMAITDRPMTSRQAAEEDLPDLDLTTVHDDEDDDEVQFLGRVESPTKKRKY